MIKIEYRDCKAELNNQEEVNKFVELVDMNLDEELILEIIASNVDISILRDDTFEYSLNIDNILGVEKQLKIIEKHSCTVLKSFIIENESSISDEVKQLIAMADDILYNVFMADIRSLPYEFDSLKEINWNNITEDTEIVLYNEDFVRFGITFGTLNSIKIYAGEGLFWK